MLFHRLGFDQSACFFDGTDPVFPCVGRGKIVEQNRGCFIGIGGFDLDVSAHIGSIGSYMKLKSVACAGCGSMIPDREGEKMGWEGGIFCVALAFDNSSCCNMVG